MTNLVKLDELAPDFELKDVAGRKVRLSSYRDDKIIVLAFLRGFM